jgi:hypothetical protein
VTQLGQVGFEFLVIIFELSRVIFFIRVKILTRARPVTWSGRVGFFSGRLGRVYRVGRPMIRSRLKGGEESFMTSGGEPVNQREECKDERRKRRQLGMSTQRRTTGQRTRKGGEMTGRRAPSDGNRLQRTYIESKVAI